MATVGQQLTTPDTGWQRIDDTNSKIMYIGAWTYVSSNVNYYSQTCHYYNTKSNDVELKFRFKGTKLRIISFMNTGYDQPVTIKIDDNSEIFSVYNASTVYQAFVYEKLNLNEGFHTVSIISKAFLLDAIDIDNTGYLAHPILNQVSSIQDMQIGDVIPCRYKATTSGAIGILGELGTCTATEIPVASSATPDGLFYFVKVDKGLLIADRVVQHTITWDTLNSNGFIEGKPLTTLIPTMTSNTAPIGIASASSINSTTNDAWKAFDKSTSTYWASNNVTSGTLSYDFGINKDINEYAITPETNVITAPTAWTFEGWNGLSWIVLDTKNNVTNWVAGVKQRFSINPISNCSKFRLNISAVGSGGTLIRISEFEVFSTALGIIRSLSGGVAYTNYTNKRIISMLLHGEGSNGSTNFIDSSPTPKTLTASGSAQIKTDNYKFGSSAMYFNGTTDYVSTPAHNDFNFGADDFTIDFWMKRGRVSSSGTEYILGQSDSAVTSSTVSFIFTITSANIIRFHLYYGGTSSTVYASTSTISDMNWHHICAVRNGQNIYLYVDGVVWASGTIGTNSINSSTYSLSIGRLGDYASNYFNGYIDEFRIVNGKAEYTSAFTPPTTPYNEPTNTLTPIISTTDKGFGGYPTTNEWDKYIVNSDLGGKITKGDDNIWHWKIIHSWCKETPVNGSFDTYGVNTSRIVRGNSLVNYIYAIISTNTGRGFRPVLEYLETDANATTLWY